MMKVFVFIGWNSDVCVNDASGECFQVYPAMTAGPDGTLHAVWEDYRNGEAVMEAIFIMLIHRMEARLGAQTNA